jgi:hypothetical protein
MHKTHALSLLCGAAALVFVKIPDRVTPRDYPSAFFVAAALADDNEGGDGNHAGSGEDGSKGEGSGRSGNGDGSSKSGPGKNGGDGENSGNGGTAGDASGGQSGKGRSGSRATDNSSSRGGRQISPVTGDRIELSGSKIEVVHPNGMKEKIENGRYEMKDARGRTIIRRSVTQSDRTRLRQMVR